jgi:diguanylate cyclase (GGDEF)-like protein
MLYQGQAQSTFSASRSSVDVHQSSEVVGASAPALLERMCADSVQVEFDLDRDEIAIFVRNPGRRDSIEPSIVCTLDQWLDCVEPADRRKLRTKLLSLPTNSTRSFEAQFRIVMPDGRPQWTDLHGIVVRDERALLQRIVWHQHKRASIAEAQSTQMPSPFHDPLTGLPNRRLFERRLSDAVEFARQRSDQPFAVLFIDLDRFKAINDRHGHLVGDQTLLAVAQRFCHCIHSHDLVARRDGDEFTILVTNIRYRDDAAAVAERILLQLRSPLSVDDTELVVSASIGIALSGAEWLGPDDLLRSADEAMYQAKALGGGRYVMADREGQNRRFGRLRRAGPD